MRIAELLINVHDTGTLDDGDVLCAFNSRRRRCAHLDHVCHLNNVGKTREGLRPLGCSARWLRELTHQYKFQRVSRTEVERHNLWTGDIELFGAEYMDVPLFIERRLKHERHAIFGKRGKEFWFGGKVKQAHEDLDAVWLKVSEIEGRVEDEEEFQLWPMGRLDIRSHLAIRVEDFTDDVRADLESPLTEEIDSEPVTRKIRNVKAKWRQMLVGVQERVRDVKDRQKPIGKEWQEGSGKWQHRSKDQSVLTLDDLFEDKRSGGKFQPRRRA